MKLITIRGTDTTRVGGSVAVHAPVDHGLVVKSALVVDGENGDFHRWQEVDWFFFVDKQASALFQRVGADFSGVTILLLLAAP